MKRVMGLTLIELTFILSILICSVLAVLSRTEGTGLNEHVFYYGFPKVFLTYRGQEFFSVMENYNPFFPFGFSVSVFPLMANMALIWFPLHIISKIILKLWKKLRKANSP